MAVVSLLLYARLRLFRLLFPPTGMLTPFTYSQLCSHDAFDYASRILIPSSIYKLRYLSSLNLFETNLGVRKS